MHFCQHRQIQEQQVCTHAFLMSEVKLAQIIMGIVSAKHAFHKRSTPLITVAHSLAHVECGFIRLGNIIIIHP